MTEEERHIEECFAEAKRLWNTKPALPRGGDLGGDLTPVFQYIAMLILTFALGYALACVF